MSKETRAFNEGMRGEKPDFIDWAIDADSAAAKGRGYETYKSNEDLAEKIATAMKGGENRDSSNDYPDTSSYTFKAKSQKQELMLLIPSAISLGIAYALLTISTQFSFLWCVGILAAVIGIPAAVCLLVLMVVWIIFLFVCNILIAFGLAIIEMIKYFIANPV